MKSQPLSGREFPRFSGVKTFFRLPQSQDVSDDVVIVGVPYDGGTSYRPGSRFAPSHIREASSLGRGFHLSRELNIFERLKITDGGDCSVVPIDQQQTYKKIESHFLKLARGKQKFVAVGGDHSITLPVLRAVRAAYGQPVALIHFDAHLDTYPAAWGCEFHHGAFLRHAVEEGLVAPEKSLQIGIRGPLAGGEDLDFVRQHKIQVMTVDDIRREPLDVVVKKLPVFKKTPVYITYDVDCLDPAFAPGTGTPVVGGLSTYEVQRLFRALQIEHLVGADIVEVSPPYDHADITALAAVDALFEMLCLMVGAGGKKSRSAQK